MSRNDDWSVEDDLATTALVENASKSEYTAFIRSLRRKAGLDLTFWEKAYKRLLGLVGVKVKFN